MSERGSTGASSRYTTRPLSRWRSLAAMEKLIKASTATQAAIATTLRIASLLGHDEAQHDPAHAEQYGAGRGQHHGFREQRGVEQIIVARHIEQERCDPQTRENPVAVSESKNDDHQAGRDARSLEGRGADHRGRGESKERSTLDRRPPAPREQHPHRRE